jgi:prepilin-type N-terminal cleavage/methylation domain-containing protein
MNNNKKFISELCPNKKTDLKRGFTLIELLVVIAIIGILSSIVYVSLGSARAKSKDKVVQTQLASMKMQAEIYYDQNNNSYSDICIALSSIRGFGGTGGPGLLKDTKDATAITSGIIVINNATQGTWQNVTCHATDSAWAVEAPTSKSAAGTPKMYCIDSKPGLVEEKTSNLLAGSYVCPTS